MGENVFGNTGKFDQVIGGALGNLPFFRYLSILILVLRISESYILI
jgi:hypothetical protein